MTKFTRNTKDVKDIQQLSKNVVEENDIVSTVDGRVYIVTKTDFIEVGGSGGDIEELKSTIKDLTTKNNTNKTNVSTNTTDIKKLKTDVEMLNKQATDFESRIKALETPAQTE